MATPKIPSVKMPGLSFSQMPARMPQSSLSPDAFNQQIANQGVRFLHLKLIPNPRVKDVRGDDADPGDNQVENGSVYYGPKEFTGSFGGDDLQKRFNPSGTWDDEQAIVLIPTEYSDGTALDVQYYDRLVLLDFPIRYPQRVEHSVTGVDRLHFPALKVDFLMDSSDRVYRDGVDFEVRDGEVHWLQGGNRPGFDLSNSDPAPQFPDPLEMRPSPYGQPAMNSPGKGQVYSISYYCYAQFTVTNLPHQLRIGQTRPGIGQPSVQTRFSQLAVVKKDFVPNDPHDKVGPNSSGEPDDGGLRAGR